MLRESARNSGVSVDVSALFAPSGLTGVPDEGPLTAFAEAALQESGCDTGTALTALIEEMGDDVAMAATATIAAFQMTNRVVDAAALRLTPTMRQFAEDLGIAH